MKSQNTLKQSESRETAFERSIQKRAYELYLKRGQKPGHELEDWLQAEREIGRVQARQKTSGASH